MIAIRSFQCLIAVSIDGGPPGSADYMQDRSHKQSNGKPVTIAPIIHNFVNNPFKGLATSLANLKSQHESLSERNLTMQEAIDKKMEAYQQKVYYRHYKEPILSPGLCTCMQHKTLYMVLNTIDNISESCKQYSNKPIKEDKTSPAESKLKHIQVC
jgi:hypothetical protein